MSLSNLKKTMFIPKWTKAKHKNEKWAKVNHMYNNMQNEIKQIKRKINLLQNRLEQFKKRQNLLEKGLEQIAKMQNPSENELNQITKMQNQSRDELHQIAKMRRNKNYEKMSKEKLIISLSSAQLNSLTTTMIMAK